MADKKFLDEDGVSQFAEETKKYVDKHADNADIHVTADDKANWNSKQDALTAEQLAAVNSGINATAKGNYDAHIANSDIHVTAADKTRWNGKQDALTSQQLANIADVVNKANASDLTAHTNNADIHVTTADKSNWNGKQDALTSQQLANIADVVNKANDSDVVHKTGDETISGIKSFYDVGRYYIDVGTKSSNFLNFKALNIELDSETNLPTKNYTFSQNITSAVPALYLGNYYSLTAQGLVGTDIRTYKYNSSTDWAGISIRYALNDETYISVKSNRFEPSANNATVLGTTANKWKDVNTVLLNGKVPAYAADLSAVATSGSYNDLSDKPTIPTVNNATLTIQKNGTTVKTFTANASSNVTANIVVPTKTSELTNDSGFLTTHNPVDNALSSTSTNAVQNKVVNTALNAKANDADVVHKSSDETIVGNKRFSGSTLYFNHANVDNVQIFADTEGGNIRLTDSDDNYHYEFDTFVKKYLRLFCENSSGEIIGGFCFHSNGDFYPAQGAIQNLGTSSLKWKTFNGINPGALSLPNHNSYLDIKSNLPVSVSDDLWATRYQITPTQDGILILQFNNCSGIVVWTNQNLPSYGERGTSVCIEKRVQAFVLKGVTYNIVTSNYSQVVIARLFYCQGNV